MSTTLGQVNKSITSLSNSFRKIMSTPNGESTDQVQTPEVAPTQTPAEEVPVVVTTTDDSDSKKDEVPEKAQEDSVEPATTETAPVENEDKVSEKEKEDGTKADGEVAAEGGPATTGELPKRGMLTKLRESFKKKKPKKAPVEGDEPAVVAADEPVVAAEPVVDAEKVAEPEADVVEPTVEAPVETVAPVVAEPEVAVEPEVDPEVKVEPVVDTPSKPKKKITERLSNLFRRKPKAAPVDPAPVENNHVDDTPAPEAASDETPAETVVPEAETVVPEAETAPEPTADNDAAAVEAQTEVPVENDSAALDSNVKVESAVVENNVQETVEVTA